MRQTRPSSARSRVRLAVIVVAPVLALGLLNAQQAVASPPTEEYQVGIENEFTQLQEFGADAPASKQIIIGPATRRIQLQPGFTDVTTDVICIIYDEFGDAVTQGSWSHEEWNEPPGFNAFGYAAGSPVPRTLRCGTVEPGSTRTVTWTLTESPGAPAEIRVSADPAKQVAHTEFHTYAADQGDRRTIGLGTRVRISGEPGTWGAVGQVPDVVVRLVIPLEFSAIYAFGEDVTVSADNSVLAFTVPSDLGPEFVANFEEQSVIRVESTTLQPATGAEPSFTRGTVWTAWATFIDAPVPTTTAVKLSSSWGLSIRAVKATATVKVPTHAAPLGTVTFSVDGKPVGRRTLTASSLGKITYTLPLLKEGTHRVTASYSGYDGIAASVSPSVRLRILRWP